MSDSVSGGCDIMQQEGRGYYPRHKYQPSPRTGYKAEGINETIYEGQPKGEGERKGGESLPHLP